MKQYRYVLFDWDGTLAKTLDIWLDALRTSLNDHNYNFSDKAIGANYEIFKQRFEAQGHIGADAIINKAINQADMNIPAVRLYPNALETLQYLQDSGKRIALVTTSFHEQIDPLLKRYSLQDLFDAVICADDTERVKPDPQPIKEAVRQLNANYKETLIVGDSENDILAAHHADIDSMLFYPESHDKFHNIEELKLLAPTYIIHELSEIMHLL